MLVIGLCSNQPQSGKSTVAGIICDYFNKKSQSGKRNKNDRVVVLAFADPIKKTIDMLLEMRGIDPMDYETDDMILELNVTYRELCQTLGTEWGRCYLGKTFWTDIVRNNIYDIYADKETGYLDCDCIVVSDVRFPEEVQLIRELDGILVRIDRDSEIESDHESEQYIRTIQPDYIIDNNCPYGELQRKVHDLLDRIKEDKK